MIGHVIEICGTKYWIQRDYVLERLEVYRNNGRAVHHIGWMTYRNADGSGTQSRWGRDALGYNYGYEETDAVKPKHYFAWFYYRDEDCKLHEEGCTTAFPCAEAAAAAIIKRSRDRDAGEPCDPIWTADAEKYAPELRAPQEMGTGIVIVPRFAPA